MHVRYLSTAVLGTVMALACGCGNEPLPEPSTAVSSDGWGQQAAKEATDFDRDYERANVEVDPRIADACDLPTPYFDFDSASLKPEAAETLSKLSDCFTTGPLAGRSLVLVGHADPRGPSDYNMALGQRRAGSVEDYLIDLGLPEDRIDSSSRGELDATGTDEASWARDRKVAIWLSET